MKSFKLMLTFYCIFFLMWLRLMFQISYQNNSNILINKKLPWQDDSEINGAFVELFIDWIKFSTDPKYQVELKWFVRTNYWITL